jgi:chromosome segregation ATPase
MGTPDWIQLILTLVGVVVTIVVTYYTMIASLKERILSLEEKKIASNEKLTAVTEQDDELKVQVNLILNELASIKSSLFGADGQNGMRQTIRDLVGQVNNGRSDLHVAETHRTAMTTEIAVLNALLTTNNSELTKVRERTHQLVNDMMKWTTRIEGIENRCKYEHEK